jgi:hypothetical protein
MWVSRGGGGGGRGDALLFMLVFLTSISVVIAVATVQPMQSCGELVVSPLSHPHSHTHSHTRALPELWEGGSSIWCFHNKAVTFDTCKRLLLMRQEYGCNALTYTHSSCSLHDRSLPSWKPMTVAMTVTMSRYEANLFKHTKRDIIVEDKDGSSDESVLHNNMSKPFIRKVSAIQMFLLSQYLDSCIPQQVSLNARSTSSEQPSCLREPMTLAPFFVDVTLNDTGNYHSQDDTTPGLAHWLKLPRLGIIMAVTSDWVSTFQSEINSLVDNWECYARAHNYAFVS